MDFVEKWMATDPGWGSGLLEVAGSVGPTMSALTPADECGWVYTERNELIAFLTQLYPAHLAIDPEAGSDWLVVCVHSLAGQMSWHVPAADAETMFAHLQFAPNDWDGHTSEAKYERLRALGLGDTIPR